MAFLKGEEDACLLHYKSASQELVLMSPDEFLRLAGSGPYGEADPKLRKRMSGGRPLDALFLEVNAATGNVTGHEGRHRAAVAKELGISEVPVILYHQDEKGRHVNIRPDPYHREEEVYGKRYAQLLPWKRHEGP
jgi:hypothetical protein